MTKTPTQPDSLVALAAELHKLDVAELTARYVEAWGRPPRCRHKRWLEKQILRRENERRFGGLSKVAQQRLEELMAEIRLPQANSSQSSSSRAARGSVSTRTNGRPSLGTVLQRTWKGQQIRVTVTADGFEHEGTIHHSLSALANQITGQHLSGNRWFGLTAGRKA